MKKEIKNKEQKNVLSFEEMNKIKGGVVKFKAGSDLTDAVQK